MDCVSLLTEWYSGLEEVPAPQDLSNHVDPFGQSEYTPGLMSLLWTSSHKYVLII